jgi:hypothetical protein
VPRGWAQCFSNAAVVLLALALSACAILSEREPGKISTDGLDKAIVDGDLFRHVVYRNRLPPASTGLHVYIEGDGTPYLTPTTVAADPTPRKPLMLKLMLLDHFQAVYVGRPCYFGLAVDRNCESQFWTLKRFSPEVVSSLDLVIRNEMALAGVSHVELYGHSGGGALAVLLAQRQDYVVRLITIAGNLDIVSWVTAHGYTLLEGSLNPADGQLSVGLAIHTQHYVGARDNVILPAMVAKGAATIGGLAITIPGYSHQCCWEKKWPSILDGH